MTDFTVLRLSCSGCKRNLVDVKTSWDLAEGQLNVHGRPGVVEPTWWAPPHGLGPEVFVSEISYMIRCRCGRDYQRRQSRIQIAWEERAAGNGGKVVRAELGTDV